MQVELRQKVAWMILMGATLIGVMLLFGAVFWQPNAYLMHNAGDGLKAYYALEYFLRFQDLSLWHAGMQYPNGNYLLFVDMNPLLALILHPLNQLIPLAGYSRGLVNGLMMLAFFPAAWAYWRLFLRMGLPHGWAIAGSLILLFLSPQIQRITGHFSLSYPFFVPICWILILRMYERMDKWGPRLYYALFIGIMGLAHPYYMLLGFGFLLTYLFIHALQFRDRTHAIPYLHQIWLGCIPLLILKGLEWALTDGTYVDIPYGIAKYHAGFESIFIPMYEPFWSWWNAIISVKRRDWEGYAYVGLPGLIFVFFWLGRIIRLFRRKLARRVRRPVLPEALRTSVWVAVLLLIPAFAYPFQWEPDWVAFMGPLAQFRSTGRLAWIFYSVFMALNWWVIYALYRRWRLRGKALRGWILAGTASFSWLLAIWSLFSGVQERFLPNHLHQFPEQKRELPAVLAGAQVEGEDFQAILTLPFFHIGSEKFTLDAWKSERYGYVAGLSTGLPMVNSRTARASLESSKASIQTVAHPLIPRELLQSLPSTKPLLLLLPEPEALKRAGELALLSQATKLGDWAGAGVYALPINAFSTIRPEIEARFRTKKDSLHELKPGVWSTEFGVSVEQNSFGDAATPLGESVFATEEREVLFEGALAPGTYEVSFWGRIDSKRAYFSGWRIIPFQGEQPLPKINGFALRSTDILGDWVRISQVFTLVPQADRVQIQLSPRWQVDNLLIRPLSTDIFQTDETGHLRLFNNYPL